MNLRTYFRSTNGVTKELKVAPTCPAMRIDLGTFYDCALHLFYCPRSPPLSRPVVMRSLQLLIHSQSSYRLLPFLETKIIPSASLGRFSLWNSLCTLRTSIVNLCARRGSGICCITGCVFCCVSAHLHKQAWAPRVLSYLLSLVASDSTSHLPCSSAAPAIPCLNDPPFTPVPDTQQPMVKRSRSLLLLGLKATATNSPDR